MTSDQHAHANPQLDASSLNSELKEVRKEHRQNENSSTPDGPISSSCDVAITWEQIRNIHKQQRHMCYVFLVLLILLTFDPRWFSGETEGYLGVYLLLTYALVIHRSLKLTIALHGKRPSLMVICGYSVWGFLPGGFLILFPLMLIRAQRALRHIFPEASLCGGRLPREPLPNSSLTDESMTAFIDDAYTLLMAWHPDEHLLIRFPKQCLFWLSTIYLLFPVIMFPTQAFLKAITYIFAWPPSETVLGATVFAITVPAYYFVGWKYHLFTESARFVWDPAIILSKTPEIMKYANKLAAKNSGRNST